MVNRSIQYVRECRQSARNPANPERMSVVKCFGPIDRREFRPRRVHSQAGFLVRLTVLVVWSR